MFGDACGVPRARNGVYHVGVGCNPLRFVGLYTTDKMPLRIEVRKGVRHQDRGVSALC